tara:strand:+ start:4003 stop:6201 length:2199 start_codon:yes stop_codon:yes gene_type:complete
MAKTSYQTDYNPQITNYLSRDFSSLKQTLIQYTKTYFPDVYQDFNETSPGMMLLELNAYVGDVLNYYVDDSFKEMILPLTEDRRNIINLSKVTGYKPRPIVPSFADISFTLTVDADTTDLNNIRPNGSQFLVIEPGTKLASTSNPDIFFETIEPLDFTISSSIDEAFKIESINTSTGIVEKFSATREVKAVSGETKTLSIQVGQPEQFKKIILPETNVIEIINVTDNNNNVWYEVEYLAQENVPISTYYAQDPNRVSAYTDSNDSNLPVPYSLSFVKSTKRFIVEVQEDNKTALIFGNGVRKNGNVFETTFLDIEQEGISLPKTNFSPEPLDVKTGQFYASLGESPNNITLTIKYRVGGGTGANLPANDLKSFSNVTTIPAGQSTTNLTATNNEPALGGKDSDSIEEIRQNAIASFASQQRCVTKEDYEARIVSMLPRYGSVAKVYCTTGRELYQQDNLGIVNKLKTLMDDILFKALEAGSSQGFSTEQDLASVNLSSVYNQLTGDATFKDTDRSYIKGLFEQLESFTSTNQNIPTIDVYLLSYDFNGNLIKPSSLIRQNIKNFLSQFRLLTDKIRILEGYIINFGVIFDVLSFPNFDKNIIKAKCIEKIKEHYDIKTMQFKETLYTTEITSLLSQIEGVKAVNDVIFTQDKDFSLPNTAPDTFTEFLYSKSINIDGDEINLNQRNYGYRYNFEQFFNIQTAPQGRGVVLPSVDPSVFEIKNMNTDIKGVVR